VTPDLLEELRALDPAAAVAARAADHTARAAAHTAHAGTRHDPTTASTRRSRPWWQPATGPVLAANTAPVLAKAALTGAVLAGATSFGVIAGLIVRTPWVRPGLAVLGAVGILTGVPLGRRLGRSPALATLALWSIGVILAFTVIADLPLLDATPTRWSWPGLHQVFSGSGWADLTAWTVLPHGPLKVLLYLPAGLLLTALTRRPARAVLALAGLSVTVDVLRAWATHSIGSNGNVVAETLGALLGAGLALLLPLVTHDHRTHPPTPTSQQ